MDFIIREAETRRQRVSVGLTMAYRPLSLVALMAVHALILDNAFALKAFLPRVIARERERNNLLRAAGACWPCGSSYMRVVRPRPIPTPTVHSLLLLLLKCLALPPARSRSKCTVAAVVVVAPRIKVRAVSAPDPDAALPVPPQAGQDSVFRVGCQKAATRRGYTQSVRKR